MYHAILYACVQHAAHCCVLCLSAALLVAAVYIDQMRALEKELGIAPDPEVDALLKAEAVEGKHSSIVTDLMLRVLGLEVGTYSMLHPAVAALRAVDPASVLAQLRLSVRRSVI
jgi:hypothetical protein